MQEEPKYGVKNDQHRAAQNPKDAASSILRSSQRKQNIDWGYPRTGSRKWQIHADNAPRTTLTPGLTEFFSGGRSAKSHPTQRSVEATLFKSGTKQVEDAVLSLTARREELEQDIKSLEVSIMHFMRLQAYSVLEHPCSSVRPKFCLPVQLVKERHLKTLTKNWKQLKVGVGPFREDMETLLSTLTDGSTTANCWAPSTGIRGTLSCQWKRSVKQLEPAASSFWRPRLLTECVLLGYERLLLNMLLTVRQVPVNEALYAWADKISLGKCR